MATITVDKALGLDMRAISFEGLLNGSDYVSNSSLYRIYYGSNYYEEFRGTGFRYNGSGEPIGGTVNTYFVSFEGRGIALHEKWWRYIRSRRHQRRRYRRFLGQVRRPRQLREGRFHSLAKALPRPSLPRRGPM